MKKTTLALGSLLALGLVANTFAETTNVYSRNAVGYVNITLPKGYSIVAAQLNSDSTNALTLGAVFGAGTPDGCEVHFFNGSSYTTYTYAFGVWWDDAYENDMGTTPLPRNTGFWFYVPNTHTAATHQVAMIGEVPSTATTSIPIPAGFRIIAFPYPTARNIADTVLHTMAQNGDTVHIWNGSDYASYTYFNGSWLDTEFNPITVILVPGQGFWFESLATRTVAENKPYLWP